MRFTTWFLIVVGLLCFPLAAVIAVYERDFVREARVGSGVVVSIDNGPHHAMAKVTLPGRRSFLMIVNTRAGVAVGQRIPVRYLLADPERTAEPGVDGVYASAWEVMWLGVGFIVAALVSPLLVRRFPNLFGYAWARYLP